MPKKHFMPKIAEAYGGDRHLATRPTLGLWRGRAPLTSPTITELFTTALSRLSADTISSLPSSTMINSPAPQVFVQNGELIEPAQGGSPTVELTESSSQVMDSTLVVALHRGQRNSSHGADELGLIHHATPNPGEQSSPALSPSPSPAAPILNPEP